MTQTAAKAALQRLSPRQLEVLQCAARGMCIKVTARQLGVTIRTVEEHRELLKRKLKRNLYAACALAGAAGLTACSSAPEQSATILITDEEARQELGLPPLALGPDTARTSPVPPAASTEGGAA